MKICGITRLEDGLAAAELGADMVGFVFAKSPRRVAPEAAAEIISRLPRTVEKVGVFVKEPAERVIDVAERCGLTIVQLHGEEPPEFYRALPVPVIKVFSLGRGRPPDPSRYADSVDYFLLDTFVPGLAGGTGRSFDWSLARGFGGSLPIIVAGGLNPENVQHAIKAANPFAVDAASGIESSPGIKDRGKMAEFIKRAKEV